MNEIVQHIPAFVETMGEPPPRAAFSTLAELEAVPFVARWKTRAAFIRYSKSDNVLMAEYGPTEKEPVGSHWVIGFIRDISSVELPQWTETEGQRLQREAWNRGDRSFRYQDQDLPV